MADVILEMQSITKEFSGVKALDDVNFQVKRGEIHALCGENGAGKSTLMNVLSGVYPYGEYSGQIIYNGEECRFHDIRESEHKGIVIIHQELALSPNLSIAENVFLGNPTVAHGGVLDWNMMRRRSMEMLEQVGLHGEHVDQLVGELGVGKQQLIEIAKALAKEVDLLIFDEPTASLNDEESNKLLDLMISLKAKGITCVMISHKLNEVSRVADSITILRDGKTIETLGSEEIDEDRIIKGMVGREIKNRFPSRESHIGETRLEVKHWNVYHPDSSERKVINDVSFNVRRGEVVGLAGLMGAGRTELAMSMFGGAYGQNISGEMIKDGKPLHLHSVRQAIDNGLAYVSEDRKNFGLILMNDTKWNMTLPSLEKNFTTHGGVINKNEEIVRAEEYKTKINIKCNTIEQVVSSLSGGNQQKVVLAKWMLADPDILILDEPTRGIDVGAKYEIYTIINDLVAAGKSVIVISSDMVELLGVCDRLYVINEGEIAGELSKEEMTQEKIMKTIMTHLSRDKSKADAPCA